MRREIEQNSLRHSVQKAVFCPMCRNILDVSRAVEVSFWRDPPDPRQLQIPGAEDTQTSPVCLRVAVACVSCFEARLAPLCEPCLTRPQHRVEVLDGRVLFPPAPRRKAPSERTRNPVHKKDVEIGATYRAAVSGREVEIRITGVNPYGGWDAVSQHTGKRIRIRSAARLRGKV